MKTLANSKWVVLVLLAAAATLFLLDRTLKDLVSAQLAYHDPRMLGRVGSLAFGTIYGIGDSHVSWPPNPPLWLATAGLIAAVGVLLACLLYWPRLEACAGLALYLSGGTSNALDRARLGGGINYFFVVDYPLPSFALAFNLADLAAWVGIALLAWLLIEYALGEDMSFNPPVEEGHG